MDDTTTATSGQQPIEVDDGVYEVLRRTADYRGTDLGGVVRYLRHVPAVPDETPGDDE